MNPSSPLDQIRVVLSHTSHPGNIGASARAMKTMGLSHLVLLNPKKFPHPDADDRATGAIDLLERAQVCAQIDEALQGCVLVAGVTARRRDLSHEMVSVREGAQQLAREARANPVALLFGTEMSGLSNAELDKCQLLITIPANQEFSSLNLASAVQIVAYELRMATALGNFVDVNDQEPATFEQIENFYAHLEKVIVEINFLDPENPKRMMQRMRRIFARARLEKNEVDILRGVLTMIERKIR
ncbi:MAG: RNA methyltransferase [Burkholderiales bacterium]